MRDDARMAHILVIDDEPGIAWTFREFLRDDGHSVAIASSAEDGLQQAGQVKPDAIFLDVRLPGQSGLEALHKLRKKSGQAPVIVMTAFGNLETAVGAVEQGAFDYLPKPFDWEQAAILLNRALASRTTAIEPAVTDKIDVAEDMLVGASASMQAVFRQIALVAASDVPVLVTGESGTGKELVSRAIHRHSRRKSGPLLPVCLAALNAATVESELFGHVRGAFSGANANHMGLFERAAGGTVLLDEIGDVPLSLQVKLLRAIERREVIPVGDSRPKATDFRVIATTNRRLRELLERGEFREDFFFRLSVVQIELPPLRERPDDIPLLAQFFLQRLGEPSSRKQLSPAALCELSARSWPGNVRELRNAIEHAAIMSRGEVIDVSHLPSKHGTSPEFARGDEHLQRELVRWVSERLAMANSEQADGDLFERFLATVEPPLLQTAFEHFSRNRAATARVLGLHRATLRQKLKHYGIDVSDDES